MRFAKNSVFNLNEVCEKLAQNSCQEGSWASFIREALRRANELIPFAF